MQSIARFAGVHLYSETGDMVWGYNHFLAIYAQSEGTHIIRFPGRVTVEDPYRGKVLGQQITELNLSLKRWETSLLIFYE